MTPFFMNCVMLNIVQNKQKQTIIPLLLPAVFFGVSASRNTQLYDVNKGVSIWLKNRLILAQKPSTEKHELFRNCRVSIKLVYL